MPVAVRTREQLIEDCQGLVRSLAAGVQKGLPRHLDLDDLISYGQVGLAEAARDFDETRGGQFTTFAYYRIRGAIYDGLSKMSWVSRAQYNRLKYQQMADDVLRLENEGHSSKPDGLEQSLSWLKSVTGQLAVVYLSAHSAKSEEGESLDVEDSQAASPQAEILDTERREKIREIISQLPPDARTIVQATYFEGLTLTEAAARLGIGKAWASRLHAKALQRMGRSLRLAGFAD